MSNAIKESVRVLLSGIIDYAGLFPPSGLSMTEAVVNYAKYKNSNYNWMLGRFVVPVEGIWEFTENARDFFSRDSKGIWRLSVLASKDIHETVRAVEDFNANFAPGAVIDSIELKVSDSTSIVKAADAIPDSFTNYFEIPIGAELGELVSTLASKKQRAKIRTGGVTPEQFPTSSEIIRFIRTCMAANIPFKATAGLHHPIRCFKPLTYEPNAPKATMHGFLNLFMATGFARDGFKPLVLEEVLEEEFEEVFEFDDNGASWQKKHFLSLILLANLREKGAVSFGSCSFEEPIAELEEIGIL
ncbi:MAG: hypothetical protein OEM82_14600 [Acidobacteriota bacterium]|nr:hypothetical protein [Acidobacteriota bacterium]MDH3529434.1 hypothetical protein [Acidobacteriota bacterium]